MIEGLIPAVGGLGLFLLGMTVMTDGLKALADKRLRSIISRSTKSPLSGVCTGAVTTAMVQSSSATTIAAVGFVHSGLLTFSEALGIIFGANIGTTITGWLVALIGFKLKLGKVMLPVILLGMLLRLFGKGRARPAGMALAGFGLIFVGITTLQDGMIGLQGTVTPDSFPPDTTGGRLLLLLIGVVITLITQSSSAGVATALAAVHTETISLNQAAAMVIGMDLGTTATAALATIGGNIQAKRTGFAHVIYNAMTAVGAFLLLSPFLTTLQRLIPGPLNAEFALVGFHTFFNGLGVLAILPFTKAFAAFIERLFPERGNPLAKRLDTSLLESPDIALESVMATLQDIMQSIFGLTLIALRHPGQSVDKPLADDIHQAIHETRDYLERIVVDPTQTDRLNHYARTGHILDHLHRMSRRMHDHKRMLLVRDDEALTAMTEQLIGSIERLTAAEFPLAAEVEANIKQTNEELESDRKKYRKWTLRQTSQNELTTGLALQRMDTARWLSRVSYHAWRIATHGAFTADPRAVEPESDDDL